MARRSNIHTVFHVMEEKGVFERNPANVDSRDQTTGEGLYKGPVQYPRMMYHPQGAERIIVPAEIIVTPMGPQRVGEQRQLVYKVISDANEETVLRTAGWHLTPAAAVRARMQIQGLDMSAAPPKSKDEEIEELSAKIAKLQAEKADREAQQLAESRAGGNIIMPKVAEVAAPPPPDPARMGL